MTGSGAPVGIVLAAGAGSRYGMPKVLAHDGLWLSLATSALSKGGCGRVFAVLGAAVVSLPPGITPVHNPQWEQGMSASLQAGLMACIDTAGTAAAAVVSLVDTPDINSEVVSRVITAGASDVERGGNGLARAVYQGVLGHPVVIGREHWDQLVASLTGAVTAQSVLSHLGPLTEVECGDLATGLDHDFASPPLPPGT